MNGVFLFLGGALVLSSVAAAIAWMQKKTLIEIFGFDPRRLWWYRDLALGTLASIATLWAVALLASHPANFDRGLGVICLVIGAVCCGISPNRVMLVGMSLGAVAVQGWLAYSFSKDIRFWWIAVSATALVLILLGIFGKRPLHQR
jgi:hypothetical protein